MVGEEIEKVDTKPHGKSRGITRDHILFIGDGPTKQSIILTLKLGLPHWYAYDWNLMFPSSSPPFAMCITHFNSWTLESNKGESYRFSLSHLINNYIEVDGRMLIGTCIFQIFSVKLQKRYNKF